MFCIMGHLLSTSYVALHQRLLDVGSIMSRKSGDLWAVFTRQFSWVCTALATTYHFCAVGFDQMQLGFDYIYIYIYVNAATP